METVNEHRGLFELKRYKCEGGRKSVSNIHKAVLNKSGWKQAFSLEFLAHH